MKADVRDDLSEYRTRVARVLDTSLPPVPEPQALRYPDAKQMYNDVASFNVNLRDFYRLQECELGTLVAERNTALGKTAHPSQRYIYEIELLNQLQRCSQYVDDPALKQQLQQWRAAKQAQRPALWANLVQTSQETRAAFGRSTTLLTVDGNPDAGAAISALMFIDAIATGEAIDLSGLENELSVLDSSRLPAKIWRTQRFITSYLNSMSSALETLLPQLSCPAGKASEQVKILRNVFYLFFIENIQPVGSKLNQYHYQMLPVWQRWQQHPALSAKFKAYLQTQSDQAFNRYQQAIRDHVALWQTLFARCNLSPQAPVTN
ncbi:DUF3080 family protein [Salinimonas chungwhensis]|uniref:DUF3080 family protein n=1 Tax=Salinimonas chungwhensis TaxID=265425 RepID=UPI00037870F8|nr:DUF3080 family protein [Salinimonas chungwhensis]